MPTARKNVSWQYESRAMKVTEMTRVNLIAVQRVEKEAARAEGYQMAPGRPLSSIAHTASEAYLRAKIREAVRRGVDHDRVWEIVRETISQKAPPGGGGKKSDEPTGFTGVPKPAIDD